MKRADYIAGLRAMADFYEEHPEVRIAEVEMKRPAVETNYFNSSEEQFLSVAKAFGTFDKKYDDTRIWIGRELAPGFTLRFEARRDQFCKKVTKTVPAHTVHVPEEKVEEWECGSLLAAIEAMGS